MKRAFFALVSAVVVSLAPISNLSEPREFANASSIDPAQVFIPKLSIESDGNTLTAKHVRLGKSQKVRYQWQVGKKIIQGATAKRIPYDIDYCGKPVRVKIAILENGSPAKRTISRPFNPKDCLISTGPLSAWPLLHDCGISGPGTCEEYKSTPGTESLFAYVFEDSKATTWLKVPLPEVEPSRVKDYFVIARGVFGSYTMRLWMVSRDQPSWSPQESFYGATYSTPSLYSSTITSGLLDPKISGAPEYVGFYFYDPYGVGDGIVIDSISVGLYFR